MSTIGQPLLRHEHQEAKSFHYLCKNERDMDTFRIGDKIYCTNFDHYGIITKISADTVDTIVSYTDGNGETHKVYAYMVEKA